MSSSKLLSASNPFEATNTPWSTVGYLTYKRTYSRRLVDNDVNSPTEEWNDTVNRVVTAANEQLGCGFTDDEQHRLRYYMTKLKGTVAGRFLWQLGTPTVERLGLPSLQNCAFVAIDNPIRPFTWTMDMLMLGSGVGFSIQKEHVSKLPAVKKNFVGPTRHDNADADFIVPDTREGWVSLLERTLEAAFARKKSESFSYSTQLIRGKGAPIKGFGGVASGAEILCEGIGNISKILEKRAGKPMRPIDCLDIMNIIGSIVVAGNVRRSAQLAIGDPDDVEYLLAKRWDLGNIPPWRSMSNNSVACDDISQLHEFFWDGYEGKGEPYGLINLTLSKKVGRLGDTDYPDPTVVGYNPCLTGDALVSTPDGDIRMDELVRRIASGETSLVYSYNESTGVVESKSATWGALTRKAAEIIELELEDGKVLKLTPDHKVFTQNRGYVEAKDLTNEDILIEIVKKAIMEITRTVRIRTIRKVVSEDVYDITVSDNHNFFANGLLVHNCAEQSLGNFETCCLAEIYLPNIESEAELHDVLMLLYRVNKHSLALGCHNKETEKIVNENMRMGIGVTGYLQATPKQKGWLSWAYKNLRQFDKDYSVAHKFPVSVKLTTCKPSGTLSLLPGVTPGCHPGYAQYMIRRISMASNHALVEVCRQHGYDVEYRLNFDGSPDYSTVVVSFPFSFPEGTVLAKDMTAIQQLKVVKEIQQNWSDNSVSCTVYYRKEELPEIKKYLAKHYSEGHKSLSFLLHSDHGFKQAPYEEITKEQYDELVAKTKLITTITEANIGFDDAECALGACPIR